MGSFYVRRKCRCDHSNRREELGRGFNDLIFPSLSQPSSTRRPNLARGKITSATTMYAEGHNPSFKSPAKGIGKRLAVSTTSSQQQVHCVEKAKGEGPIISQRGRRDKGDEEGERSMITEGEEGELKRRMAQGEEGKGIGFASAFLTVISSPPALPPHSSYRRISFLLGDELSNEPLIAQRECHENAGY